MRGLDTISVTGNILSSYLTDLSAGDQAKVLGGTAARLVGFDNAGTRSGS